jgi:hypothetical protein
MTWLQTWIVLRVLRWLMWLGALAYYVEFLLNRRSHLGQFGSLMLTTELWMFALPLAAMFAGFFELAAREKAGLSRPAFLSNWAG